MTRLRRLLVSLIAALIAAALVYAVYVILLKQVELPGEAMIVPGRFIAPGTIITEDMLDVRQVLAASVDDQMITTLEAARRQAGAHSPWCR